MQQAQSTINNTILIKTNDYKPTTTNNKQQKTANNKKFT